MWLCLLTLVHLSLHPAPLVTQLPRYHDNQQATLRAESPVAFLSQGERAILSAADDPGYPVDVAFAGDDGWDAGWTPRTGTGLRQTHEAPRMVPQTLDDEVSWPTDLSPGKDVRDKRMLLTKEDSAQDAENVDFVYGRDAREAGPPTPDASFIASSRKGTSAKSEARPSASRASTALPGLSRSLETHREETQLERVPVWTFSHTVSPPHRLPPHPLVLPQIFPTTDLRYLVNPEHLADVSNGKVNTAVDSETRITGVHGEYQHQFSDGGGQQKETQTQISPKHLMYSSASSQHQSHLTRNNHDTIQTDTHSANHETILTNQDSANHETILTDQNGENQNKIHTFQHSANHETILTDQHSANKNTIQTVQHGVKVNRLQSDQHPVVGDSGGLSVTALPLDTEGKVEGRRLEDDGFVLYAYNVTASDALPMDRPVPDTRPQG